MTKKTGKATGTATEKTTDTEGRQTVKPVTAIKPLGKRGTFGIMAGSRKEEVAATLQKDGPEAALAKADQLGLKLSSTKSWLAQWRREGHWKQA